MEKEQMASEQETARLLERTVRGRTELTLCYLTYASDDQRKRVSSNVAEKVGAHESVSLGDAREASTQGLVELLGGPKGTAPLQVTDPGDWPGGAVEVGKLLSVSRGRINEECPRPLLICGTSTEVNAILQGGQDLHSWSSGVFDFAANERKPIQPGGDPALPVPPQRPGGTEKKEAGAPRSHNEPPRAGR